MAFKFQAVPLYPLPYQKLSWGATAKRSPHTHTRVKTLFWVTKQQIDTAGPSFYSTKASTHAKWQREADRAPAPGSQQLLCGTCG